MVAVGNAIGLAIVIGMVQSADTLVHGPVAEQAGLRAGECAVVSIDNLLIGKHLAPYAHLVDVALEATRTELDGA